MTEFLIQPAGVRLTWSLVHFLWQGAAIAALLIVVLRSAPNLRPNSRYLLSMAALVLMAACPLTTWYALGEIDAPVVVQPSTGADAAAGIQSVYESNATAKRVGESGLAFQQLLPTLQPYLLFAWLVGVLLLGSRLVSGYLGILWLKSARTLVPESLAQQALHIGRRLGVDAKDRIFGCSRIAEAIAVGYLKPIVLVPASWLTELPANVLEAVIAHELAHIRRWDLWSTLVQRVVETLLFYHPAVWWLSRRVSLEREMCCDELAVMVTGRPVVYAQVLEYLGGRTAAVSSLALATSFKGAKNMNLLTRVQHVLGVRSKPEGGRLWLAGLLAMVLALGGLALSIIQIGRQAVADDEPAASRREGDRKDGERRDGDRKEGARREGDRDTPKRDGETRRSAESRDGDRKPAEGERRRSAEGDERKSDSNSIEKFQPQNAREEGLYKMIMQLRKETAELRGQVNQLRGSKEDAAKDVLRRKGDKPDRPAARDGDALPRREAREGDRNPTGPRDGDKKPTGPRDGEEKKVGPRDGEERQAGPRDGEKREGDKPRARDGEK